MSAYCAHKVHENPGLIIPCPECGKDWKWIRVRSDDEVLVVKNELVARIEHLESLLAQVWDINRDTTRRFRYRVMDTMNAIREKPDGGLPFNQEKSK